MLFGGKLACFSPSVDASLRSAWVNHGGAVTSSKQEFYQTNFFFCNGTQDPWLQELLSRSLIVRDARWISKSVSERFAVPVSKYLLDDQFDLTKIEPAVQTPSNLFTPTSKLLTANRPLACPEGPQKIAAKPNILKRGFASENHDDSCTSIDLRPFKRARTQPVLPPQLVNQTSDPRIQSPAVVLFPHRAARTNIFYPSPANSSPLKTPSKAVPRAPKSLPHIDFAALKPTPSLPVLSFPRPRPARHHRSFANPQTKVADYLEDIPQSSSLAKDTTRPSLAELVSRCTRQPSVAHHRSSAATPKPKAIDNLENISQSTVRRPLLEILRAPPCTRQTFAVLETYEDRLFVCSKIHRQPVVKML
ncbi:BRCT domain-containing protein [Mycena sanguinolenta]|uniref:BRCT domain-containing protein n=1 Tax=Mycena sanguinolenta TaxID=230812 RepID=A0A8H6Z590_9AGAR|nr:BRCT domain-containing protein [Mycena sanguinolenta]